MSDDVNSPDPAGDQPEPSPDAAAPEPDVAAAGAGGAAAGGAAVTAPGEPESDGPSTTMIVAIVVVVLALLGVLAWLLFGSDDGDDITSVTIVSGSTIDVSVPTTVPETTVPETTVPETTVPETTAPPTTVPETTAPPTTVPETTAPPETTTPPTTTLPEIIPDPDGTVADIIAGSPGTSRLAELLVQTGLDEALGEDGPFTVFGPSNDAFELFESTSDGAAIIADPAQLEQLLLRHVVAADLDSTAVFGETELDTLAGEVLRVDAADQTIDGAAVLVADTQGTNGYLHVVDAVLVTPPTG